MLLEDPGRLEQPLFIVLDDYFHVLADERLLESVACFTDALPESVHLMIAGRAKLLFMTEELANVYDFVG